MNVPKLRFPGFVGEWEERRLGSVSDVRDGTHDSPKYVSHGYPFITSKNLLANGEIDFSTVNYISQIDYDNFNKRSIVEVGDILFGMIGTIGNAVIVKSAGFAIKNVALVKQSEQLLNSFLLTYLFSPILVKRITDSQVGGTQQFVSLSTIRNLIVALPSLEEQQKIATFLSSVDNVIQLLTKKKTLLENYKKGIMQKIFSQEIRFKDKDGNDFADWEEKRLGEVVTSKSTKYNPSFEKTKYKCVELEHLDSGTGRLLGYSSSTTVGSIKNVFKAGDVLFGKLRPYLRKYLRPSFNGVCSSEIWVLTSSHMINNFLFYLVQTNNFVDIANISSGSKMPRADWSLVAEFSFLLPSLPEQQKIADFLSGIDRTIDIVNSQIEKTKEYKKGLLQQMFV